MGYGKKGKPVVIQDPNLNEIKAQMAETMKFANVKAFGAKGDTILDAEGKLVSGTDDTLAIQSAIDSSIDGVSLLFPKGIYLVDADNYPILLKSNTKLIFDNEAYIKVKPNSATNYEAFRIHDIQNVIIHGGTIIGERYEHTGTTGEWGYGISIRGSKNIVIYNTIAKDCWGDGLLISKSNAISTVHYSENVVLNNVVCDNNRRQGISIGGVKGLWINGGNIKNTNGILPEGGIDIEPDAPTNTIQDIWIRDLRTENNHGGGILVALNSLDDTSEDVTINIENHIDKGSKYGFYVTGASGNIQGKIKNNNPYYRESKYSGIQIVDYDNNMPRIEIVKPNVYNCNTSGSTTARKYSSGITLMRESTTDQMSSSIGNVHIIEPIIIDDRTTKLMLAGIFMKDELNNSITDISLINPIRVDVGTNAATRVSINALNAKIEDKNRVMSYDMPTNVTLSSGNYWSYIINERLTGTRMLTLGADLPVGYKFEVVCSGGYQVQIDPPTTEEIVPLGNGLGKYIHSSNQIGQSIILEKISSTKWAVKNMIGTWGAEA